MNEVIEILATPGAIGVSLLWIHSRLNHVEQCLECIARATEANLPRREPRRMKSLLPLVAVSLPLLSAGCASITQSATEETVAPDGSYTVRTVASKVSAIGDARSLADKLTVSQDAQAIGAEGAETSASATNAPALIDALTRFLEVAK
jgi:hypothetical protein